MLRRCISRWGAIGVVTGASMSACQTLANIQDVVVSGVGGAPPRTLSSGGAGGKGNGVQGPNSDSGSDSGRSSTGQGGSGGAGVSAASTGGTGGTVNGGSSGANSQDAAVDGGVPHATCSTIVSPNITGGNNGNPTAYIRYDRINAILSRDAANHIRETHMNSGYQEWKWVDLSAAAGAPGAPIPVAAGRPFGFVRSDCVSTVVYRSTDAHVRAMHLNGSVWTAEDLTSLTQAPAAAGEPSGYVGADGIASVLYRDTNAHIRAIRLVNSKWMVEDLTDLAKTALTASDPVGYINSENVNTTVFRGSDDHIYELVSVAGGGGWVSTDLSISSQSPSAAGNPAVHLRTDNTNSIVFRGVDNHVHTLERKNGESTWTWQDLMLFVDAGSALATGNPSLYLRSDGTETVLYRASDRHLHEVSQKDSVWYNWDLTDYLGASEAAGDPSGYVRSDKVTMVVFRNVNNGMDGLLLFGTWYGKEQLGNVPQDVPPN